MYRLDMQMPNIFPPLLLPFIHLSPHPFPSFQNTHARRFERAKSIERCQRARGLEDSRDVSDRTLFSLLFFFCFLFSFILCFFLFYVVVVVASQKLDGKDELLEKRSRRKRRRKKEESKDTFKMPKRERLRPFTARQPLRSLYSCRVRSPGPHP